MLYKTKDLLLKAYRNKGVSLSELGKDLEAIECYDKALEIDPYDLKTLYNKAYSLAELTRHEEAVEIYDLVIKGIESNELESEYEVPAYLQLNNLFDEQNSHSNLSK